MSMDSSAQPWFVIVAVVVVLVLVLVRPRRMGAGRGVRVLSKLEPRT